MASSADRAELARLVGDFRARLEWLQAQGVRWLPAAASPRRGAALPPEPIDQRPGPIQPDQRAGAAASPAVVPPEAVLPATSLPDPAANELGDPAERLRRLRAELGDCQRCRLGETRQQLVFGVGSPQAELLFIGEAPGRDEDLQGEPFVGAAGQLLTKMIGAMGLQREEVYIANIIKCRPPQNRDPAPDEVGACEQFLREQVAIIGPRIIVALGNHAAKTLLRTEVGITRLRGRFHAYQGVPLMPTFHPAYLLRNPEEKRAAWQDLKMVMAEMDRLGLRRRR